MSGVSDRQEIGELCSRYARALDARAWDELHDVFSEDVVMEFAHVGEVQGVEAIAETCSEALTKLDASQHLIGTVLATVDGDRGSCRCYFQAQHVAVGRDGGETFLVGGEYQDELRREAGGWRIIRRKQSVTWTSGNPDVVF